jgi:hypothetical protein
MQHFQDDASKGHWLPGIMRKVSEYGFILARNKNEYCWVGRDIGIFNLCCYRDESDKTNISAAFTTPQ